MESPYAAAAFICISQTYIYNTYCVPIVGDAVHAAPQKHNDKLRHVLATKMVDAGPLLGHAHRTSENATEDNAKYNGWPAV